MDLVLHYSSSESCSFFQENSYSFCELCSLESQKEDSLQNLEHLHMFHDVVLIWQSQESLAQFRALSALCISRRIYVLKLTLLPESVL